MLESVAWKVTEADVTLYTDACLQGIGFWCQQLAIGLYAPTLLHILPDHIFYHEAYAVVCALHWICHKTILGLRRIVIYSDNMNTVDIFHLLKARGLYNGLLKEAVDLLMTFEVDLQVLHVEGSHNTLADLLSRSRFNEISRMYPAITVTPYKPPAFQVGATL